MDLIEDSTIDAESHWYYVHKGNMILSCVEGSVSEKSMFIDIGAGSGVFSRLLLKKYPNFKGIALDAAYGDELVSQPTSRLKFIRNYETILESDFKELSLYLFIDVLEHIENDIDFLKQFVSQAQPGSHFVISVPAFKSLWSGHDVYLGHKRRYSRKEVHKLMDDANLVVEHSRFIFSPLFLIIWFLRKLPKSKQIKSQMRSVPRLTNLVLVNLLRMESNKYFSPRFGSSILVHARKL